MKTPSQFARGLRFSSPSSAARTPLGALFSQDLEEHPLLRLRKRDRSASPVGRRLSPPKQRVTFDLTDKAGKKKAMQQRSAFIAGEAEESDDEATFGFGVTQKPDDDEEEDGEEQDQMVEGLVDDKPMDDAEVNAGKVVELARSVHFIRSAQRHG